MKRRNLFYVVIISTILLITAVYAQDNSIESELYKVISKHVSALEKENFDSAMSCYHSQTPAYPMMSQVIQKSFIEFDFSMKLISVKYIGMDNPYAFASVKVETRKISGPMFPDNSSYYLYVFKKDLGKWKIWTFSQVESIPI